MAFDLPSSHRSAARADYRRSPQENSATCFNGRIEKLPHSPSQWANDTRKPSLPPLKMVCALSPLRKPNTDQLQVLADAISSPPQTPRAETTSRQPSPREPTINTYTFKPPALYPNKKVRNDLPTQYWLDDRQSCALNNAAAGTTSRDPKRFNVAPLADAFPVPKGRRGSSQASLTSSGPPMATSNLSFSPGSNRFSLSSERHGHKACGRTDRDPRSSERAPVSPTSQNSFLQSDFVDPNRRMSREQSRDLGENMYFTARVCHPRPPIAPMQDIKRELDHNRWPAASDAAYRAHEQSRGEHMRRDSVNTNLVAYRTSCGVNQAAFFLPPHCDYQQGKSRKRTNLPKQSTEIMKNWFDQVRQYTQSIDVSFADAFPHTEHRQPISKRRTKGSLLQCRSFPSRANTPLLTCIQATGISMTQVSNWFINHRRRCPELRDKRERVRESGCIND